MEHRTFTHSNLDKIETVQRVMKINMLEIILLDHGRNAWMRQITKFIDIAKQANMEICRP